MQDQIAITLIRWDLILETIAGIIALMVSHYANRAFDMTGQKKLSDLSTGFLVLSVGMFARVIGTLYFFVLGGSSQSLLGLVTVAYGVMKIMAYAVFAYSTHRSPRSRVSQDPKPGATMLMALPFLLLPELELIAIIILMIVVFQTLLNYTSVKTRYALYVFIGFALLLLSHLLSISATDDLRGYIQYLAGQLAQFLGLISFLVMLRQAQKDE
ncbi:MAG: hypothetical protein ACFFF4_07780 [Candidatus Thorarchaeota archaeon]